MLHYIVKKQEKRKKDLISAYLWWGRLLPQGPITELCSQAVCFENTNHIFVSALRLQRLTLASVLAVPLSSAPCGACAHPVAAVQPLLHDADELLVAELVVAVLVEDLEDRVDQVVGQLDARGHVDGAGELI